MIKLRKILLHNFPFYIILIISLILLLITTTKTYKTSYKNFNNKQFIVTNIVEKDNNFQLFLKGKEKVIGYLDKEKNYNLNLGDKITINGEKQELINNTTENVFNYKRYLYNQKIYNVININEIKQIKKTKNIFYKLKNTLIKKTNKNIKTQNYVLSLLFGNSNYLEKNIKKSYQENGISHLFAISGLHIGIFTYLINSVLKKIKIKERKRYLTIIIFLLFFIFLTNFSMSVLRGGIFTILLLINKHFYFFIKPINILLLTLSIILFINPLFIYSIGLQFSFTITLFLILYQKIINDSKSKIIKLFKTSLIAFLASYPIVVNSFFQINLLSIIYNIFFVPYMSFLLLPSIILEYIFLFLEPITYFLITILEKASLLITKIEITKLSMCKLEIHQIIIYYITLIFVLSKLKKHKFKYLILIIILITINYNLPIKNENYIYFFDVGQGDSCLLKIEDTITLIDTGGKPQYGDTPYKYTISNNITIPYLKSQGIKKIDNLIITHGDIDHIGEATNLVENLNVENVIFNCGTYNNLETDLIKILEKKNIKYYSCIKELNIDKYKLQFLNTKEYNNENDNSSVIYLNYNNYKYLFMGDAGIEKEKDVLEKYKLNNIDFLKVGHHGSDTSSSEEFINQIQPKYSFISVGKNNRYNHPKESVLNTLKESKIYRTDKDGSIEIKLNRSGYKISICPP